MNFPIWEIPFFGGSGLIALIAVVHVFIAHFAVGGGIWLALTEAKAYRESDKALLGYVRSHSKFFVLLTLVFGAVTGVGIWFTIGLISPAATSMLIHQFVWGWAIEWVFFLVEIIAALVYYAGWDRLDRETHVRVAWIYAVSAYLSLVVINGILTFMVTPGPGLQTHNFWQAWLNPGYWPSLVLRTGSAIALVALFTLLTGSMRADETLRVKVVRYGALWLLPAFILMPLGMIWYLAVLPEKARFIALGGAPVVALFTGLSLALSVLILLFGWFGARKTPKQFGPMFASLLLLMGFVATGTTEWVREAVRKPFIIYDYMYSNSVRLTDIDAIRSAGILKTAKWADIRAVTAENKLEAGRAVYILQCLCCHEVDGGNAVRPLVRGWDEAYVDGQLRKLDTLKGFMPPFIGNNHERQALAHYLASLNKTATP
jgi:cytochrome bd-type quinol oxidase subunit 1